MNTTSIAPKDVNERYPAAAASDHANKEKTVISPSDLQTADTATVDTAAVPKKPATAVHFGFDDAKPGTVDPSQASKIRFPNRGRELNLPVFAFTADGFKMEGSLPFTGLSQNEDGLVLKGTPSSASANFTAFDAPSQAVASLYDVLSQKFPKLESSVLWRLAKVGTYVAIDVPLMVASHEASHGAAGMANCSQCSPTVVMTSWMSGYTQYNLPGDNALSPKEKLFMSVAGMNQATYNGEEIERRMHTQGADVADAVAYLVNITNSANYQMKDWIKNSAPGYNDGATYHAALEARNKGWNQANLSTLAVGVNLMNADFWASLIGSAYYIATGKQVKMPELTIGTAAVSMPHFSLINTYEGPQLNTSIYGHLKDRPETLELKYTQVLTPDQGAAFGIETRLHNLEIPGTAQQVTISPRVGYSLANEQHGFKAGANVEYRPGNNRYMAVTAGIDYRYNYLSDAYLPGGEDGLYVTSGLKLNF